MRHTAFLLAIACLAATPAINCELDERLLGLDHLTLKVDQALTPERFEELEALGCQDNGNTVLMCPIPAPGKRGVAYILMDRGEGPRVGTVMSYWACEPSECAQVLRDTVDELSKKLGAKPEQVDGAATWRDREGPERELAATITDSNKIVLWLSSK